MIKLYVKLAENGNGVNADAVECISSTPNSYANFEVGFDSDGPIDLTKREGYYVRKDENDNAVLLYSEELYQKRIKAEQKKAAEVKSNMLMDHIQKRMILESATDEDAAEMWPLYPEFSVGILLAKPMRIQYDNKLYKVIAEEPFITTAEWTPDVATSLFVEINPGEWAEYKQPIGANPYMQGDKVTYNGKLYVCQADNTVWSPDEAPERWEEQPVIETV